MGRKVKIATFGFNQGFIWGTSQEDMIPLILEKVDSIKGYRPDLVVFPEVVLRAAGDDHNPRWLELNKKLTAIMCEKAAEMKCYIILPIYEPVEEHPELRYNVALIIDREGRISGRYRKVHTVVEEHYNLKVLPAKEIPVFDLDFGRVGIQICFDIGWRDAWQQLADQGAELVVWASAYDGGNLLNTYAAYHMYYIVSSVRTDHAKIIDITGRTVAQGGSWNGLAMATIDLDTTLFHVDRQYQKINQIRKDLGDAVDIRAYSQENVFTLTSNSDEWPVERICQTYGLENYKDYHARATSVQEEVREKYPTA